MIRPFQPVVVRGFSKYTRIATQQLVLPSGSAGAAQPAGVVERRLHVVDAAGSDDDQQAIVLAVEDRVDLRAAT